MSTLPTPVPIALPSALERLALSRERLRVAMVAISTPPHAAAPSSGLGAHWLANLQSIPGASIVIEAVQVWWAQHPLRATANVAMAAAQATVSPLAQKHPLGLIVAALLLGGLLARSRPWRWALKPMVLASLLPQLLMTMAAKVPMQSWLDMLNSVTEKARRTAKRRAGRSASRTSDACSSATAGATSHATPGAPSSATSSAASSAPTSATFSTTPRATSGPASGEESRPAAPPARAPSSAAAGRLPAAQLN